MPNFADIPLGWSYPQRKRLLEELLETKGKYNYPLKFQNQLTNPPVYTVQIDLPKYRLGNGRTQAVQEEYLAKHPDFPKDFFTRDAESEEAQRIQHELLYEMVEKTDLISYFKDPANKQDQPLILSHEGFVVNGNRRICAMRMLLKKDAQYYSHFAHIDVIILPKCDPKDIDELEAYLQIQPDIKEDYTWIAKACMLRARQQQHHYSNQQLANLYKLTEKEVESIIGRLGLVDEYLRERVKEKQYDLVEDDEYAFIQLQKGRQQIKEDDHRDLLTEISFSLIDDSNIEGRLYQRIPEVKEHLSEIAERLAEDMNLDLSESQSKDDYEIFGSFTSKYTTLTQTIATTPDKRDVVEAVIDVIDSQKEKKKQRIKRDAVLREVSDANAHLKNAINCMNDSNISRIGVKEQLISIRESIQIIEGWLANNA
jgi:hypothetical protein